MSRPPVCNLCARLVWLLVSCSCLILTCFHSAAARSEQCLHCRDRKAPPQRRSTAETVRAFEELSRASAAASSVRGSQASLAAGRPQASVTSSLQNGSQAQPVAASAATLLHSDPVCGRSGTTSVSSATQQGERDAGPEGSYMGACEGPSGLQHHAL